MEADPLVRAYIVEYGLVVGLLIAILCNSSVLILSWPFFTLYLIFKRRYKWNNTLTDSLAYSLVATLGLYALITWLLDAANDIYVLLFHTDPHLIVATLESWTNVGGYLSLAILLVLFLIIHMRIGYRNSMNAKRRTKTKIACRSETLEIFPQIIKTGAEHNACMD